MSAEETVAAFMAALDLPSGAQVGQRVPKKMLAENGAPTAADKRAINDGIEELVWVAALKPNTIGVPEYRDEAREYLEIAVLQLVLRAAAKTPRLIELTHRAVPYPVLLLTACPDGASISAAHKRWSQNEAGRTVLDGDVVEAIDPAVGEQIKAAFRETLSLNRQPRLSLFALYQGWLDTLLAYQAACKTGRFVLPGSAATAVARQKALANCVQVETEITQLRAAAGREKQISRLVMLNMQLRDLEIMLAEYKKDL